MSDQAVDWKFVFQIIAWVLTAIAAVILAPLKWVIARTITRLESQNTRLEILERNTVTRQDFQDALDQIKKDSKEDRAALHSENVQHLDRIECKIDENEERNNDLRSSITDMVVKVAVLIDRDRRKQQRNRNEENQDG